MMSATIGEVLRQARKAQGVSRADLAALGGVSTRLVAELERGERPNVSLETSLQLLKAVGITMRLSTPGGVVRVLRDPETAGAERAARAAVRRNTWVGMRVGLDEAEMPLPPATAGERLSAVAQVSRRVNALANATRTRLGRRANRAG